MKYNCILLFFICALLACGGSDDVEIPGKSDSLQDTESAELESDTIVYYIAALTGMNLREEPSTRGKVIQLLPYGTSCEVKSQSGKIETIDGLKGEWIEVKAGDLEGFIFSGYTIPIPLPQRNPATELKAYLAENMIRMGNEETSRMTYDAKTESYDKSIIPKEEFVVKTNNDRFEQRQEYAGGYYFAHEIGYEYEAHIGLFPGISIQDGFLLARAIFPEWGYEGCKLNLGKLDLPAGDSDIAVSDQCNFQVKVIRKDGQVIKISFLNEEQGYYGLEITDTGKGIEIKDYFAL